MNKTKDEMVELHYQLVMDLSGLPEQDVFGASNRESKNEIALTLIDLGKAISGTEPHNLDDAELVAWLTGKGSMLGDYGV